MAPEQDAFGRWQFDFYEVVRVVNQDSALLGREGAVLGRSRSEDGTEEFYAVGIDGWMFAGSDLVTTGRRLAREDFYDGTVARVSADGHLLGLSRRDE